MKDLSKLVPLTGLRGAAACSVLFAHAADEAFKYGNVAIFHAAMQGLAYFGMSLFFVLSGFVIEYNYAHSFATEPLAIGSYRRFFVARFARLYPLYLFSLAVFFQYIPHPNFHPLTTLSYLTLSQSWFNAQMAVFPPDWSISTEWFFYFAFIPLTILLHHIRAPVLALFSFCVAATAVVLLTFHFWTEPLTAFANHWFWHNNRVSADAAGWLHYYNPYIRLLEFITGMLVAKSFMASKSGESAPLGAQLLTLLAFVWCGVVIIVVPRIPNADLQNIASNFIFAPGIALIMLNLCRYKTALSRLLASAPAVFLGEISYSIYIWSFAALTLTGPSYRSLEPSWTAYANSAVKLAVTVALTIVIAFGSYTLIEAPSRRWLRGLLSGTARQ